MRFFLLLCLLSIGYSFAQERPDFTLQNLDGQVHTLSEWDGQVVLINLWATWCPPCRYEIPYFIEFYEKNKEAGLVVVGIAFDDLDAVKAMRQELLISYPLLLAQGQASNISRAYGNTSRGLPYSVLINRQGQIVERRLGLLPEKVLQDWLNKHL